MAFDSSSSGGGGGSEWGDPCTKPDHFKLDQKIEVSLDTLSRTVFSGGVPTDNLDAYLAFTKQQLLKAAEGVAFPIDYITGGGGDDSSSSSIPIVRIWPIQASVIQKATSGFNLSEWLSNDVCFSRYDQESICVDQKQNTLASDDCLYPWIQPDEETNRYLKQAELGGGPFIKVTYAAGRGEDIINVCDLLDKVKVEGNDACLIQYLGNMEYFVEDQDTGLISCDITSISAPPGVQVQAFAHNLNFEEWQSILNVSSATTTAVQREEILMSACSPPNSNNNNNGGGGVSLSSSKIFSCTWANNGMDAPIPYSWWMSGTVNTDSTMAIQDKYIAYLNGFDVLEQSFDLMSEWWKTADEETWKSSGCGLFPGVCALRIRLESTPELSKGVCTSSLQQTYCPAVMGKQSYVKYSIAKTKPNEEGFNLDRCGLCTKKAPVISSSGLFGCFISDDQGNSADEILTQTSVEKSVGYLRSPSLLSQMLNNNNNNPNNYNSYNTAIFLETKGREFINGSATDILFALDSNSNPAVTKSLLKWGKRMTTTTTTSLSASDASPSSLLSLCDPSSSSSPSNCWSGYDPTYTIKTDTIIWNKAVSNPNTLFTMMCNTQSYTEGDFQKCNSKLDSRRRQISDFVDEQYRSKNGLWMHKVLSPFSRLFINF